VKSEAAPNQHPVEEAGFVDAHGVDLSRSLFPQVGDLAGSYDDWVHKSVGPKTLTRLATASDGRWAGSLRIFSQDWLEVMTHIPWWLVLSIWLPVMLALLALARFGLGLPWPPTLGWFLAGIVFWTLAEYILHRVVFHHEPGSRRGRQFHFLAHGIHHLDPWDPTRLVFPPLAAAGIAAVIYLILWIVLPLDSSLATMAGLIGGYLLYDMTHYFSHHGKFKNAWMRYMKRYHLAHHHKDRNRLFGVSQPLWDIVFRTGEVKN
jgi:sterol desaturase/sphingolipid hydroxylase (fatty acid hydroxylase superfamily)